MNVFYSILEITYGATFPKDGVIPFSLCELPSWLSCLQWHVIRRWGPDRWNGWLNCLLCKRGFFGECVGTCGYESRRRTGGWFQIFHLSRKVNPPFLFFFLKKCFFHLFLSARLQSGIHRLHGHRRAWVSGHHTEKQSQVWNGPTGLRSGYNRRTIWKSCRLCVFGCLSDQKYFLHFLFFGTLKKTVIWFALVSSDLFCP